MLAKLKYTRWNLATLVVMAIVAGLACREERKLKPSDGATEEPATLRLTVVGDPELARAIGQLKGEWHARHGSEIEVSEADDGPIGDLPQPAPDAIVFRAARLGELIESDRILPLPKDVLASDELDWADIFPVVQSGEASYGGRAYAIPFGSPVLTLCYRRDLFEKFGRKPPTTWPEYQEEMRFFQDRQRLGELAPPDDVAWHASLEPLAAGWAGQTLLARAAAYARHRDNFSTLFNIDDFRPLVDEPPFVRALEELVGAVKASAVSSDSPQPTRLDPDGVRDALLGGQCAMAVTWPSAAGNPQKTDSLLPQIALTELPGSPQCFNLATHAWDARTADEPIHLPLVPVAGRLGAVVKDSPNADAAFRLLSWLSGPQWGTQVAASSHATSLYRKSQAASPQKWIEAGSPAAAAKQYAAVTGESLSRPVWVDGLRISGWEEYQAALDTAVWQALSGEQTPADALHAAAQAWREISERLGVDRQLLAYRRSLGLD